MRFRNIEFRWSPGNNKYELVKWNEDPDGIKFTTCYVIAFFDKDKEGYNMTTVGNRFFEDKDAWVVGKHAIEFLNEIFMIEQDELNYD
jgi:hypothetical protein